MIYVNYIVIFQKKKKKQKKQNNGNNGTKKAVNDKLITLFILLHPHRKRLFCGNGTTEGMKLEFDCSMFKLAGMVCWSILSLMLKNKTPVSISELK
jgi:hypothetical protein